MESYTTFQLNISKHVCEKCGKLCISSILSCKRGITSANIDEFYPTCMEMMSYTKFKINMPWHIGENDNIDNNK